MIAPETLESLKKRCLSILSKEGEIDYYNLDPISKATWNAYLKGFMECAEFLLSREFEIETVCASCQCVGIVDSNCICVYQNKYPTVEREIGFCRVCGSPDDI